MTTKSLLASLAIAAVSFTASAYDWTGYTSVNPNPEMEQTEAASFEMFSIMYPKSPKIEVNASASATLTNKDTNTTVTATSVTFNDMAYEYMDMCGITISFPAVKDDGTYEMKIAAGSLTAGGESNPELTFTYTLKDPSNVTYGELELVSIDPASGTALPCVGTPDEDGTRTYTVNTNQNGNIGFGYAVWYDVTKGTSEDEREYMCSTDFSHLDSEGKIPDTPLTIPKYGNYANRQYLMYEGHKYLLEIECYNRQQEPRTLIGTVSAEYTGTSEAYVYATEQFIAVTPDPANYIIETAEEGKFTVTFSGPVEVSETDSYMPAGFGAKDYYESITPNDDKTEWTFVIPENVLKAANTVTCFVAATDSEGRRVAPNDDMKQYENGAESTIGCMFVYSSDLNGVAFDVTPESGEVTELSEFKLSADGKEVAITWNAQPYISNKLQQQVYVFDLEKDCIADDDSWTSWTLKLSEPITDPGTYSLIFPAGTFQIGGDYGSTSKQMIFVYTIEETETPGEAVYDLVAEVTPAAGTVEELKDFTITFPEGPEYANILYDAYLLDADGAEVQKADVTFDWDYFNVFYANFTAVTEPGTYTLYIPQGTFGDEEFCNNDGKKGHGNAEIKVTYTIGTESVEGILAEGATADVYNVAGVLVLRSATAADIRALDKGLYIVGGKKVAVK